MQIFYVDLTVPQIFPWKILNMFASNPLFEKSFYIDRNHTSFGEKPIFFSKNFVPEFGTFWEISEFQSRSTDKKFSNSELDTSVKSDIINWRKCKENVQFQCFMRTIFLPYLNSGGNNKSKRVQKPRWETLER